MRALGLYNVFECIEDVASSIGNSYTRKYDILVLRYIISKRIFKFQL